MGCSPYITPPSRRSVPMRKPRSSWSKPHATEKESIDTFRGVRVSPMEVRYKLRGVEITLGNPRVLLAAVSFPPHQVQQPPALYPAIDHLVNLVPPLSSYDLGGGGGRGHRPTIGSGGAGMSLTTWKT